MYFVKKNTRKKRTFVFSTNIKQNIASAMCLKKFFLAYLSGDRKKNIEYSNYLELIGAEC